MTDVAILRRFLNCSAFKPTGLQWHKILENLVSHQRMQQENEYGLQNRNQKPNVTKTVAYDL